MNMQHTTIEMMSCSLEGLDPFAGECIGAWLFPPRTWCEERGLDADTDVSALLSLAECAQCIEQEADQTS